MSNKKRRDIEIKMPFLSIICVSGAIALLILDKAGWGWLLLVAVLSI